MSGTIKPMSRVHACGRELDIDRSSDESRGIDGCIPSCCIVDVQLMNARQWLAGRAGDGRVGQA